VGTASIVVDPPRLDLRFGILERQKLIDVQTLVPQATVEALYVAVFRGLSRVNEVELDASTVCPFLQRNGGEFRPVIDREHADRPPVDELVMD